MPDVVSSTSCVHSINRSFLSMDRMVLEYDLRQAHGPILTHPTRDLSGILQNQDEVNQLSLAYYCPRPSGNHKKNKGKGGGKKKSNAGGNPKDLVERLYLASADDAGTIRCMEADKDQSQVLHHDANGVAVVPTCAFRPLSASNRASLELASGGTDCKIQLWDVMKPK